MPDSTSNQKNLVLVGPGEHFGLELVRRFLAEGFVVGVVASTKESLESLLDIVGNTENIFYAIADVADQNSFEGALEIIRRHMDHIDCLIYNPKISVRGSGLGTSPDELSASLQVNVVGAVIAIQGTLQLLSNADQPTVILTGGAYKDTGHVEKFALSVGKAALHAVAKALRDPLRRRGIRLKTLIVRGAVRRADPQRSPSNQLADYFWHIYREGSENIFHYPPKTRTSATQLSFLGGKSGFSAKN